MGDVKSALDALGEGLGDFWTGLGEGRGYVVVTAVVVLGLLVNLRTLRGLELVRAQRAERESHETWERERGARLEELRRETYVGVLEACEARAFLRSRLGQEDRDRVTTSWRDARARVRFVTDDVRVIEATDDLVSCSGRYAEEPARWRQARALFVQVCREELGRADLDLAATPLDPARDLLGAVPTRAPRPPVDSRA